jgi:hypothetical protein
MALQLTISDEIATGRDAVRLALAGLAWQFPAAFQGLFS